MYGAEERSVPGATAIVREWRCNGEWNHVSCCFHIWDLLTPYWIPMLPTNPSRIPHGQMGEFTSHSTHLGGDPDNANNEPSTTPSPATLSANQAASQRRQVVQWWDKVEMRASAGKLTMLAQENPTFDDKAEILFGIKDLLGSFEPNMFKEKIEKEISRYSQCSHPGVDFSTMDETQGKTVLAALQGVDLSKISALHFLFTLPESTQTGIPMKVESLAQGLSAIGNKNPELPLTLELRGSGRPLSEDDCAHLRNALADSRTTLLILRNVLPQTPNAMSTFMGGLAKSSVTRLGLFDTPFLSSSQPDVSVNIQDRFYSGLTGTKLTALNLSGVGINTEDAARRLIPSCPNSLERLELTNNSLGEGVEKIADALRETECISSLKYIDLRSNSFGPESAAALGKAVQPYNDKGRSLQIRHNYNTPETPRTS